MADNSPAPDRTSFSATGKTAASACGGALAVVYVLFHPNQFNPSAAAALGVAVGTIFSYFHDVVSELLRKYGPKPNE